MSTEDISYSPAEFAKKFKRDRSWAYRMIRQGKIETITDYGRMMIPASELKRILSSAGRYGLTVKGEIQPLNDHDKKTLSKSELGKLWNNYLSKRRNGGIQQSGSRKKTSKLKPTAKGKLGSRKDVIRRLSRKKP